MDRFFFSPLHMYGCTYRCTHSNLESELEPEQKHDGNESNNKALATTTIRTATRPTIQLSTHTTHCQML